MSDEHLELLDPADEPSDLLLPQPVKHGYTYEELQQKMAQAEYEFSFASEQLDKLEVSKTIREMKTKVILSSRQFHLLQNEKLRAHLIECFSVDPKFKITGDLYAVFTHIEHQEIFDKYNFYEKMAKRAEKDHEMLSKQMSGMQTKVRFAGQELQKTNY